MIGYVCKYTPVEIVESFGKKVCRIEPSVLNFDKADALMHSNVCTYVKAVLEECFQKDFEGLIFLNCCDSVKRLYDVLKDNKKFDFVYLIDFPRKKNDAACKMFKNELIKFKEFCEKYFSKEFEKEKLIKILKNKSNNTYKQEHSDIGIMGARCKDSIVKIIKDSGAKVAFNLTCTENSSINKDFDCGEDFMLGYAGYLLNSFSCMRMMDISDREKELKSNMKGVQGLIYHTIKFCDFYNYEYSRLKQSALFPILKIETDYTYQSEGQIRTRVEAFIESLKGENNKKTKTIRKDDKHRYAAGIDSGSLSTNTVIMDENKEVVSYSIVRTGAKSLDSAYKSFEEALKKAHLKKDDISYVTATGYGRINIPFSNEKITEITCHAKGVHYLNNDIRTIIDIGGQDSKVIRLNENGEVTDFAMNDKCAAGTGRFLEMMARTLELPLEKMGSESAKAKEKINITSMCTVFAESEVVSLIAQNKNKADIVKGLHDSIARRTISLLDRIGRKGQYTMTGGVAKNSGVVKSIEEKLGEKIYVAKEPQIIGALGAALFAIEKTI